MPYVSEDICKQKLKKKTLIQLLMSTNTSRKCLTSNNKYLTNQESKEKQHVTMCKHFLEVFVDI